ncbi:MAG: DNA polymerase IV [Firmicutes bacterium]|nr:DNA polymerase IV [Bacillota bacterium]
MSDRVILHCDMNSFFASVELLDHPELKDKPVAVCGDPERRHGIILAKNDIAKKYGVVTAETIWQATKKCPDLYLLPPHYSKYDDFFHLINKIYGEYTDQVEPFSIDESWLDVTASQKLFGSGLKIADEIRERVKKELGLTLSAGVSFNKFFAKMGSEYKKPDATTIISRENFKDLLWPLPISEMFMVGFATADKLTSIGIKTIGDLAKADENLLFNLLGKQGPILKDYANGLDDSPVATSDAKHKIKSVGNGVTFTRNLNGENDILTALTGLSDTVASRLRSYSLKASGVKVDIRDPEFNDISRQKQLPSPTDLAQDLKEGALELIKTSWKMDKPIRLITLTAINLVEHDSDTQLSFFDEGGNISDGGSDNKSDASIEKAMDSIREKFGRDSIAFGQIIDNDIGIDI